MNTRLLYLVTVSYGEWDDSNTIPVCVVDTQDDAIQMGKLIMDETSVEHKKLFAEMGWSNHFDDYEVSYSQIPYWTKH